MKWDTPTISRFAADAGFGRPDLHTATAIAKAATNGIDHYDVAAGPPGAGRWVGLWAINVDEWPDYRVDTLLTPRGAARAAYELTQRCDGFGWSAAWRAGNDRGWLDHAVANYMAPAFQQHDRRPILIDVRAAELEQRRARSIQRARALHPTGASWQPLTT